MGAALHDVGMGISEADFQEMKDGIPELLEYIRKHPNELTAEYTRLFHHKLSAAFVKKYSRLFEIPSDEYVYCISKVASGHRDADLLDEYGFPSAMRLSNGSTVNLAYLTALVKLADELDVTSDRNLMFDYSKVNEEWSEHQTMCYKCHGAIKRLCLTGDSLILYYATDEPEVEKEILRTKGKVEHTFSQYAAVVENRTAFRNTIKQVTFTRIKN